MNLDIEKVMIAMKIIYLDAEVSVEKTIMALVFEIDSINIHITMTLMNQDIIVLLQIIMLESKIRYLRTVVFSLIPRFVVIVTKDKYF